MRTLGDDGVRQVVANYVDAWQSGDVDSVVAMLTEDACFSMPPMTTWFGGPDGGHEELRIFLSSYPLNGLWRWKPIQVQANGQPALAYYSWDDDEGCYLPFALNVLTLRGERISDVTAFITRSTEDPDPEVLARMPEQGFEASRLVAAFENFGLPERLD
jgi:RNA polymerase sigma-70 factor (ECF subfamily)